MLQTATESGMWLQCCSSFSAAAAWFGQGAVNLAVKCEHQVCIYWAQQVPSSSLEDWVGS